VTGIPAPPVIAPPLRDRGGFLTFLGIVEIVLGVLSATFGLLILLSMAVTLPAGADVPAAQRMALGINLILYAGSAVFLVVMGIGTMRVRRWARVLMLIVSWSFVASAILGIAVAGVMLPGILERVDPGPAGPAFARIAVAVALAATAGVMIGLPLFFILAYSGRHVKHTFATRHPEPGWVDRCPASVLVLSLLMALFGLVQLAGSWSGFNVLFGVPLQGPAAVAVNLVLGAVWLALGCGLYRLSRAAWLAGIAFTALIHVSGFLVYRNISFLELTYRLGGGAAEAGVMGGIAPFVERWTGVFALGSGVAWVLALLAVRRHFRGGAHGGAMPVGGPA